MTKPPKVTEQHTLTLTQLTGKKHKRKSSLLLQKGSKKDY